MLDTRDTASADDAAQAVKTRVFLSYSRKDGAFTRRLAESLATRGYVPDYDQSTFDPANITSGISAEDEWWQRLQQMISAADVMVFIVSPDSAASKVCDEEIAYARNLGKRVIPILHRPVDFAKAPPRLAALNVKLDFVSDDGLYAACDQLCAALDLDVAWYRESRRLTELALKWETEGRPVDRLMSPADIKATERLLESRPRSADAPPQFLIDFRDASRAAFEEEAATKQAHIDRALVSQVNLIARVAESEQLRGNKNTALKLSVHAVSGSLELQDRASEPLQAAGMLAAIVSQCDWRLVLSGHDDAVTSASFSPDGSQIVTASSDNTARIWDATTGDEIAVLCRHQKYVNSAAFNPDGSRIVTASGTSSYSQAGIDRYGYESGGDFDTARIWDAATGNEIMVLRGHHTSVRSAAFSPDGARIVTASDDDTARIFDANAGKDLAVLRDHIDDVQSATFSPNGSWIVTASSDKTARIWNAATGRQIAVLHGHKGPVHSAAFSPDGTRIVTASSDRTARIWDAMAKRGRLWGAATGKAIAILRGHGGAVLSAAFSPDGSRIVTASDDKTARIWEAETGREAAVLTGHNLGLWSAAFSPDGKRIVTASSDGTARIWDCAPDKRFVVLLGHESIVNFVGFSPDGKRIVTTSADSTTRIWDAATGMQMAALRGQGCEVKATLSPDGSRIVTSGDKTARVWDVATSREIATLRGHDDVVTSVGFSPDGSRIATSSSDNSVRIWDATTGKTIATLRGHSSEVLCLAFSGDGRRIVTGSNDQTARLWDAATGEVITVLRHEQDGVASVMFSRDDTRIITASKSAANQDNTARIWDVATGEEIAVLGRREYIDGVEVFRGHKFRANPSAFSPDEKRVVTTGVFACICEAATGKELATLRGHEDTVRFSTFSPDGTRVVTASDDKTARIWDAITGREIAVLRGHQFRVDYAAFSPDGKRIVTASWDGTARIWDVQFALMSTKDLLVEICTRRLRGLTELNREEMRLAGYPEDMPEINVAAGIV